MPPTPPQDKKRKLTHDLQAFLWQFEQGGYTRQTMLSILGQFTPLFIQDCQLLEPMVQRHVKQMLSDCQAYAEGKGDSLSIVQDLDRLKADLD